ncbi:MAG: winged helix DNA-binding protein [Verrucomicrobiales bacterium]|nr:winged helix DNA-binding protein [Verrucomicrobiales bacterium]
MDDAVLALLHLTRFAEGGGPNRTVHAWKGHDGEALNRLHARGLIGDPDRKSKSVTLTPEGEQRARELFRALFGR